MRSIGYIASSGSLVLVPSIVNITTSAASTALSAVGLILGSSTGSTTSGATSGNNGQIASQSISSGSYVDYGTTITYTTYNYIAPTFPPSWVDSTVSNFIEGVAFNDGVTATNMQYSGSYSVTSGSLPSGTSLNSSTGAITGTPTTQGPYSFTITASNSYGSISASFSGFVSTVAALNLGVFFNTPSSQNSLSGTIFGENTSGADVTVTLTTTAGTISPTSFFLGQDTTVTPSFTVTGLTAGQTITVQASGGGTSASQSATTTSPAPPTPQLTLDVSFQTPSSSTSLTGSVTAENTTSTNYTVSVSTNVGTINTSSFSAPANSTVFSPFTITGLSGNQTATVTAVVSGVASANNSATTTTALTYRFAYQTGGYPTAQSGESVSSEGNFQASGPQLGTTVYVNAGNCGSNGIDVQSPTYYYWRCFVK